MKLHFGSSRPLIGLSEVIGSDDISATLMADIKGAKRFLMTASLLASTLRFYFLELASSWMIHAELSYGEYIWTLCPNHRTEIQNEKYIQCSANIQKCNCALEQNTDNRSQHLVKYS